MNSRAQNPTPLETFLKNEKANLACDFSKLVREEKKFLYGQASERDEETPAIDVRLCIDRSQKRLMWPSEREDSFTWCFRTGDASYDQRHSDFTAANSITADSDSDEILDYLIAELLDLEASER